MPYLSLLISIDIVTHTLRPQLVVSLLTTVLCYYLFMLKKLKVFDYSLVSLLLCLGFYAAFTRGSFYYFFLLFSLSLIYAGIKGVIFKKAAFGGIHSDQIKFKGTPAVIVSIIYLLIGLSLLLKSLNW